MKTRRFIPKVVVSAFCLVLLMVFSGVSLKEIHHILTENIAATAEAAEVKVTTANLNLRTGPSTSYQVILVIPKGAQVEVTGYSGNWAKVTYNGKTGYASNAYLKPAAVEMYYTTASLNLRSGPGTSYKVLLVMPKGAGVEVLQKNGDWYQVRYKGTTGYASRKYLTAEKSSTGGTVLYTTDELNLRKGPGVSYAIVAVMSKGSEVTVLSTSEAWPKVRYKTYEGYCSPKYLSATKPTALAPVLHKGNKASSVKQIALTFDDSGSAANIRSILKALDAYGAKATFFPNGDFVKNNPGLISEIAAKGHEIENHGYSHKSLTGLSDSEVRNEIRLAKNALYTAIGKTSTLLRPPNGRYDERIQRLAAEEGMRYLILWSVDTSDWATTRYGVTITTQYVIDEAVTKAAQNGIILMHMHSSKTVEGLPTILKRLKDAGYSFVRISDMVQ